MKIIKYIKFLILFTCLMYGWNNVEAQNNTKPSVSLPNGFEVNSYTGNLFHSRTDFKIPGKGLQIDVSFSYNVSKRSKDWGMGKGWTFSYNMAYANDSLGIRIERMDGRRDLFRQIGSNFIAPPGVFDTLVQYQTGKFYLKTPQNITYYFENSTHKRLTKIVDLNSNQITLSYTDSLINTLVDNAGHTLNFTWDAGRLKEINDNSCTPVRKVVYNYDTAGNPIKVINPLSDFVLYYYDSTHKINGYVDENDRRMSFIYNAGGSVSKVLSCITTHSFSYVPQAFKTYVTESVNGQRMVTTYQFDTLGKVINKKGNCCGFNSTFEYDAKTNVTKKIDGKGNYTLYEYDGHGNITKETDMLGYTIEYTYNTSTNKLTSVKDKNGHITTYTYNSNGNITEVHKPLGIVEQYTYDAAGNRLSFTDGNNKTTLYEYNSSGYQTKITNAENGITLKTYDCHGNMLSETDPNNHITLFEYNALNQLTKITDALGHITLMSYDKAGNLKTLTNPLNKITQYDYDGLDRLVKVTTPSGINKQIVYDEQGNVIKQIDGNGKVTSYTYNSRKQVLSETDPLGNSIQYEYDEAGNRTSIKDKRNANTTFEYNSIDQLIKITNTIGGTTTFNYDANGNRIVEIDANGNLKSFQYDALNRLTKITDAFNKSTIFTYDAANNLLTEKDKRGNTTTYTYDNVNRKKTVTNAQGGQIVFTYDANGNVLTEKDPLNHITTNTYNVINQLLSVSNALNEVTTYSYDAAGNRISTGIANGNVITNHFDDDNRITSITDALGAIQEFVYDNNGNVISHKDANNNLVAYEYDALNRRAKSTDALGKSMVYAFDENNNLISETDRNSHAKMYTYDLLNRKVSEQDANGGTTIYTYDAVGNQLGIKDARNNSTSYSYDALNRATQESYADGTTKLFTYDENGNLKTRKDQNGAITTYTYDVLNRMTNRGYPNGTSDVFGYDAAGKLLTANNANATIAFNYDNADRALSENMNGKLTSYSYNVINGVRTITYPGGRIISEEYDDRDQLKFIKEGGNTIAGFNYDLAGRVLQKTYLNGSITNYSYNNNDWTTSLNTTPSTTNFTYTFDFEGNRLSSLKGHNTTHSEKYVFDALDRLVNYKEGTLTAGNIASPLTQTQFNYDGVGNRTNVLKDAVTTNYTSNNTNEYTAISSGASFTPTYDANGNTLTDGLHTYAYDYENRLISVDGGSTATYKYDAFGRRVQKSTSAGVINYYYNEDEIIEERNASDITQATYVYSDQVDDILSMRRAGNDYYYHKNSLGSVVAISNSLGTVIERYEYDAFGKPTFYNGTYTLLSASAIGNTRLFTGREYDAEIGIHYYRARHYSSTTGRFLQRDPLGYVDGMNLYAYVGNNGINWVDPYGLFEWGTFGATILENVAITVGVVVATAVVVAITPAAVVAAVTAAAATAVGTAAIYGLTIAAGAYIGVGIGKDLYQASSGKEFSWDGTGRPLCDKEIARSAGNAVFGLGSLGLGALSALEKDAAVVAVQGRAFHSGVGSEARAIEQGYQTLGQTRAGQNLQKMITEKNIPWSRAEPMWQRLSTVWAKGIPDGSTVSVFLNNPRADAIFFKTELPILQSKNVRIIYK